MADTKTAVPGKPFMVALHLRMADGWHVYGQNPGDAGFPTELKWKLPEGWKAGPIQWPAPRKFEEEGGMVTYGYEKEVALLVEITPPANLKPDGEATLHADASWLACEKMCVPGTASLTLTVAIGTAVQPINASLFGADLSPPLSGASPLTLPMARVD